MKKCSLFLMLAVFFLNACNPDKALSAELPSPTPLSIATTTSVPSFSPPVVYFTETPSSKMLNECIQPIVISGYQQGEGVPTPLPVPEVLPAGWDVVSTIPEEFKGKLGSGLLLVRPQQGYDELWISAFDAPYNDGDRKYLIYRTDTKEWLEAPQFPRSRIFLDNSNNVWANIVSKDKNTAVLYRLEEPANRFVPVMDKANELSDGQIPSDVKIGSDGLFWFIFRKDQDNTALYSFNPVTLEAKRYISGKIYDFSFR